MSGGLSIIINKDSVEYFTTDIRHPISSNNYLMINIILKDKIKLHVKYIDNGNTLMDDKCTIDPKDQIDIDINESMTLQQRLKYVADQFELSDLEASDYIKEFPGNNLEDKIYYSLCGGIAYHYALFMILKYSKDITDDINVLNPLKILIEFNKVDESILSQEYYILLRYYIELIKPVDHIINPIGKILLINIDNFWDLYQDFIVRDEVSTRNDSLAMYGAMLTSICILSEELPKLKSQESNEFVDLDTTEIDQLDELKELKELNESNELLKSMKELEEVHIGYLEKGESYLSQCHSILSQTLKISEEIATSSNKIKEQIKSSMTSIDEKIRKKLDHNFNKTAKEMQNQFDTHADNKMKELTSILDEKISGLLKGVESTYEHKFLLIRDEVSSKKDEAKFELKELFTSSARELNEAKIESLKRYNSLSENIHKFKSDLDGFINSKVSEIEGTIVKILEKHSKAIVQKAFDSVMKDAESKTRTLPTSISGVGLRDKTINT